MQLVRIEFVVSLQKKVHENFTIAGLLDSILSYEDTEQILEHIDEQKYTLSKNNKSNQQSYIVLLIVEQIVRNFKRWSSSRDESELTVYRRFASILDILLDYTEVM